MPIFPAGVTHDNSEVAFEERKGKAYYFSGHLPVTTRKPESRQSTLLMDKQCGLRAAPTGFNSLDRKLAFHRQLRFSMRAAEEGEYCNATSDTFVKKGEPVQIIAVEGLTTKVKPET